MCDKSFTFKTDANDLRKIMHYYNIPLEEQISCPFHDDNRPSCHVDYIEGTFYCFACGAHGNALDFVKLANPKLNDLQSLRLYFVVLESKKVKSIQNIELRHSESKKRKTAEEKAHLLDVAHDYYFGLSRVNWRKDGSEYKVYLLSRGFNLKTLKEQGVKLTLSSSSFPIIFPIFDNGEFRGYVCRTLNKVIEKRGKYLYNEGFSRVDTLGGEYNSDTVVVCEGYLDKIKLNQFGLKNVVSIFGWKITSKQVEKLRNSGVKTIISALDMDKPGRKGNDYLKNFFEVVEFAFPKGVKDPGEMTQEQFDVAYKVTKRRLRNHKKTLKVKRSKRK